MKTETKETQTYWHRMSDGEKHKWFERTKEVGVLLERAEEQIRAGTDAAPLLREALEAVRDLWRPRLQSSCDSILLQLLERISTLAPAAGEDEAAMLCEGALDIADKFGCDDCRGSGISYIVKLSMDAASDPEAGIRLGKRLLAHVEELEARYVKRRCEEFRKEADEACRTIRINAEIDCGNICKKAEDRCASVTTEQDAYAFYAGEDSTRRLERIRAKVSHLEAFTTRAGEFQKPDFAKKPTPQPAEAKAKQGDKI